MKKSQTVESICRGNDLLLPFDATVESVISVELAVDKFRNCAAAKAWCVNHGIEPRDVRQQRDVIAVFAREASEFIAESVRREKVSRDVFVTLGERITTQELETVEQVSDASSIDVEEVEEQWVTKRCEVFVTKAEQESEEDEVRFFGIVMKPGVPDAEGDATTAIEIERANEGFMREWMITGLMHKHDVSDKIRIIKNVIAPIEIEFPLLDGNAKKISKGTWYQQLYSNDSEIVSRVREGKLNGLSIGGRAKRVPADQVSDSGPDDGVTLYKRAVPVSKAEGDPIKNWFVNLRVEEVSVVDAGANEEELFLIKRRPEVAKTTKSETVNSPSEETTKNTESKPPEEKSEETNPPEESESSEEEVPTDPEIPSNTENVHKSIAETVKKALGSSIEEVRKSLNAAVEETVSKSMKPIEERFADFEKRLTSAESVRASAKGESIPEQTTKTADEPTNKSRWSGTAVGNVFAGRHR